MKAPMAPPSVGVPQLSPPKGMLITLSPIVISPGIGL